jgi:hypothetical protein
MNGHPGFSAKYETERKGNKEDIVFITLARSHVTFEAARKAGWRRLASTKSVF